MTPKKERLFRKAIYGVPTQLVVIKQLLFRCGLNRTAHLMDKVTTELGWEMVEVLTGKDPRQ